MEAEDGVGGEVLDGARMEDGVVGGVGFGAETAEGLGQDGGAPLLLAGGVGIGEEGVGGRFGGVAGFGVAAGVGVAAVVGHTPGHAAGEPEVEGAAGAVVAGEGAAVDESGHDLLDDFVGVGFGQAAVAGDAEDVAGVGVEEARPGRGVGRVLDAREDAAAGGFVAVGGVGHGRDSPGGAFVGVRDLREAGVLGAFGGFGVLGFGVLGLEEA